MSNSRERREIEELIMKEFRTLMELWAYHGQDLMGLPVDIVWPDTCLTVHSTWLALTKAAKILGMGTYDWGRCHRIMTGTQYGQESYS